MIKELLMSGDKTNIKLAAQLFEDRWDEELTYEQIIEIFENGDF